MAGQLEDFERILRSILHPKPREGYQASFVTQLVFGCLLLVVCVLYIVAYYREAGMAKKPISLFKLRRAANGTYLVFNVLLLVVVLHALAAILILVQRYKLLRIFWFNGSREDQLIIQVQGWTPLILSAWTYNVGNIAAMMQLRDRDSGNPSIRAIKLHNIGSIGVLVSGLGVGLPLSIIANDATNKTLRRSQQILNILESIQDTPRASPDFLSAVGDALALQPGLDAARRRSRALLRAVTAFGAVVAFITALTSVASCWFVRFLLRIPQASAPGGKPIPSKHSDLPSSANDFEGAQASPASYSISSKYPPILESMVASERVGGRNGGRTDENMPLKRLSRDMLLSVPIVFIMAVYFMIIAIVAAIHAEESDFSIQEVILDGVSWMSVILVVEVCIFLFNLFYYRKKRCPLEYTDTVTTSMKGISTSDRVLESSVGKWSVRLGMRRASSYIPPRGLSKGLATIAEEATSNRTAFQRQTLDSVTATSTTTGSSAVGIAY